MKSRSDPQPAPPAPAPAPAGGEAARLALFDQLYGEHAERVERWVRRLCGPGVDPEDLIHDVFLVALRRRGEFRGDAKVTTWLFRITERVVRRWRGRQRLRSWLWRRHEEALVPAASGAPTPQEELEREERQRRLYRALDRLAEGDRTVLILFELEELPGDEVAALLGIAPNALWVRLHRARKRLLAALEREGR